LRYLRCPQFWFEIKQTHGQEGHETEDLGARRRSEIRGGTMEDVDRGLREHPQVFKSVLVMSNSPGVAFSNSTKNLPIAHFSAPKPRSPFHPKPLAVYPDERKSTPASRPFQSSTGKRVGEHRRCRFLNRLRPTAAKFDDCARLGALDCVPIPTLGV